jgi:pimeloyl-ACP methyl ester carboxylesterase
VVLETLYGPIFYLSRGHGSPPLIAVHGAGGTCRHWGHQLTGLDDLTRLIALDLPGHGRSTGPPLRSIADGAQCVLALLDGLGCEHALLLGHSLGGAICQWLALHAPTRVSGLALIGTAGRLPIRHAILDGIHADWPATTALITNLAYAPDTDPHILANATAELRKTSPAALDADYRSCAAFDDTLDVSRIAVPTLVLMGQHDQLTPLSDGADLAQRLPQARLVVVPDAGHMPMIEQPAAVNAALRTFLTEAIAGRSAT